MISIVVEKNVSSTVEYEVTKTFVDLLQSVTSRELQESSRTDFSSAVDKYVSEVQKFLTKNMTKLASESAEINDETGKNLSISELAAQKVEDGYYHFITGNHIGEENRNDPEVKVFEAGREKLGINPIFDN